MQLTFEFTLERPTPISSNLAPVKKPDLKPSAEFTKDAVRRRRPSPQTFVAEVDSAPPPPDPTPTRSPGPSGARRGSRLCRDVYPRRTRPFRHAVHVLAFERERFPERTKGRRDVWRVVQRKRRNRRHLAKELEGQLAAQCILRR
ncbi:uncharacterized protein STEHIDRAFT_112884 [Stereum hirsutum FP-91666 SS1]|uniref:uncharacterized protein n=1 Tax=Stereum hirsutum (strain FP-91666) TaxID=721885 RepID=UPI00044497FA|nr:uncharacterized protein STEHIDRAFT_112884 [Stereum hirsutum FP-91666 SS1]EIM84532.1 hypothetical protein STEHIDRAFT_112884 [Stereum hirsutum FP-91666 SS1]